MFVVVVTYVSSCRCVMSVCELFTCVVRGACQLGGNTHENSSHYSLTLQSQHVNDTIRYAMTLSYNVASTYPPSD